MQGNSGAPIDVLTEVIGSIKHAWIRELVQLVSRVATKENLQEVVMGECLVTRQAREWCLKSKDGGIPAINPTPEVPGLALDLLCAVHGVLYGAPSVQAVAMTIVRKMLTLVFRYLTLDDITSTIFEDRELSLLLSYHIMASQWYQHLMSIGYVPYFVSVAF